LPATLLFLLAAQVPELLAVELTAQPSVGQPADLRPAGRLFELRAQTNLPIPILAQGRWILTPGLNHQSAFFDERVPSDIPVGGIRELGFPLLSYMRLTGSGGWALVLRAEPILSWTSGMVPDLRIRGVGTGLALYRFGRGLTVGFGLSLIFDRDFFLPAPVLIARWRPPGPWSLEATLPQGVRIRHRLGSWLRVGADLDVRGRRLWSAGSDVAQAYRWTTVDLQARLGLRVAPKAWLELGAGSTLIELIQAERPGRDKTRGFGPNFRGSSRLVWSFL
jgi:hypothetical protein